MLGIAKRGGLGVGRVILLADIGVAQDPETLGIGGHDAVFDAIMNHFDEVVGAVGAAAE